MKLLSIAVPCYNSEAYMRQCIESLLPGGEEVEILIVDDGSKDGTAAIADEYEKRYPTICRAIHQENGGHGEAVNTGIRNATGLYFKVVDSDDHLSADAYRKVLDKIRELLTGPETVDLFIANFVYDKQGASRKKVMRYHRYFPENTIFTWKDIGRLPNGKYLLMHSLIYRTMLLKESGMQLPAHTFYVDNLFAFEPLPYVKRLYYMDVDLYKYFIGRDDQSVNEQVMIRRIDQQLRVNRLMVDGYNRLPANTERHLRKYMFSYMTIITTISSVMLIREGSEESLQKKKELLEYMKKENKETYHAFRTSLLGRLTNLPGKVGRKITTGIYKVAQKLYGFN